MSEISFTGCLPISRSLLEYTHNIPAEGERHIRIFPPMKGRYSYGNADQETMAIVFSFRIILVVQPIIHFQRMSPHNEWQMSLQENGGCRWIMKFQTEGDSPHPNLDYCTHITFSRNESGINVIAHLRSHKIDHGNSGQETIATVVRFRIILVVRSISQLHRTQISLRGTDVDTENVGSLWRLLLKATISSNGW